MGAWGHQFDDNDDAADWLADLADAPDWSTVDAALAIDSHDYVEAPDASAALAAAEVVAAGLGKPSPRLASALATWAAGRAAQAEASRARAIAAVTRVRDDSELNELWQAAEDYADWQASVNETLTRL